MKLEIDEHDLRWLLVTSWRYSANRHTYAPDYTLELLQKYKRYLNENDFEQIKSEAEWILSMRKYEKDNIHNDIDNPTLERAIKFVDEELKRLKEND